MIHAPYRLLIVFLIIPLFIITGCKSQPKATETESMVQEGGIPMKVGFKYPVVEVNEMKPLPGEDDIILLVPQNSTHDVTIKLSDENQTVLSGKMQIFELTKYNRGNKIIWVAPDEAEYHFAEIVQQGYGEFITYELVGDQRGPMMVKLQIGIRQNK